MMTAISVFISKKGYAPTYAPYIYIYEKMKYFFGYAPRLCAGLFAFQTGSGFDFGDKDAGMRQGDMRQAEKAHWLRTDPGLENWICASYAPGTQIWRVELDEVARF